MESVTEQTTEAVPTSTPASAVWIRKIDYNADGAEFIRHERTLNENGDVIRATLTTPNNVPQGSYTEYELDDQGRRVSGQNYFLDGTISDNSRSLYEYDDQGNLIYSASGIGEDGQPSGEAHYTYDAHGNLTSEIQTFGDQVLFATFYENQYSSDGRLLKVTHFENSESDDQSAAEETLYTEYEYDDQGRLSATYDYLPDGTLNGHSEYEY